MTLPNGEKLVTRGGTHLTVKRKLGEGGQGEVYLVNDGRQDLALKWYFSDPRWSPAQREAYRNQKEAINLLVLDGPPGQRGGHDEIASRFIWPLELVERPGDDRFGYVMRLIDTKQYTDLMKVKAGLSKAPSIRTMCEIGYQLAQSYRRLHLEGGKCYRDVSHGNMLFRVDTGDILICDNDNVGVSGHSESTVWGTPPYMAPEVILQQAKPSAETDLHSLAVLLFELWMWHHPLEGDLESRIRCWDLPAQTQVYGSDPVFIFDPADKRNRPNDPDYGGVRARWQYCPPRLQSLFVRAFGEGLKNPKKRVTEGEWMGLFLEMIEGVVQCPSCGADNIWERGLVSMKCWNRRCGRSVPVPPRLRIKTLLSTPFHIVLSPGTRLQTHHFNPSEGRGRSTKILGEVVSHPNNPAQQGLRNLTDATWKIKLPDGTQMEVPPQRTAGIRSGVELAIPGFPDPVVMEG